MNGEENMMRAVCFAAAGFVGLQLAFAQKPLTKAGRSRAYGMMGCRWRNRTVAITESDVDAATVIFAIGCTLPSIATASGKAGNWEDVPDDKGYAAQRDAIKKHVERLIETY